uniref:Endonuclease/exonuclease/phosphatase domain-containing protein n=1 Tax=Daphnia galeata TaxID=27404 RepID=A0A8J2S111_9CRUS|nr:unnamed protein product [Daphnia galeata]
MVVRLGKDKKPDIQFNCNGESANGSLHSPNICGNDLNPPGKIRSDGQPDMRNAANKKWAAKHNIKVPRARTLRKKNGQPNIRHTLNKKGIAEREVDKNVAANKEPLEPVMNADVENVKFGLVNSRSLRSKKLKKKKEELENEIEKSKLDIVAVTETWFKNDFDLKEACPKGFKGVHESREGRRGGGVAIFHRHDIKLTRNYHPVDYKSFEYIDVSLDMGSDKKIRLLNIYRPPGNSKVDFLKEFETLLRREDLLKRFLIFLKEFQTLLRREEFETLLLASMKGKEKLLITGDFNLHVDIPDSDNYVRDFLNLIKLNGLVQHIKTPTHKKGGILDLIITRVSDSLVKHVLVENEFFSDHKFIKCTLLVEKEEIFEREE